MSSRGWRPRLRAELLWRLVSCAGLLVSAGSSPAQAALSDDVASLAGFWSVQSRVERLPPRLLARGDRIPVALPYRAEGEGSRACTTLAFVGSPSVSFAVLAPRGESLEPHSSQVGWVQLTYCGPRRAALEQLEIEMRSPRGVIEVLVAHSPAPLPSPGEALAHRDPGPASPLGQVGPAPVPPPVRSRGLAWEAEAKRDGAAGVAREVLQSSERTEWLSTRVDLTEGCHRLSALALSASAGEAPRDLDLFLRSEATPALAREDQSENSDAEISVCVGEPTPVKVGVSGAAFAEPVVLQHASFPLPPGLPERWGPVVRGRFAEAFFRRRFAGHPRPPVYETLGLAGRTLLPLGLEPQTCYALGVAAIQGNVKGLLVEVTPNDHEGAADSTAEEPGLVLAFCTGDDGYAQVRVEAAGVSTAWLAAVWRIERRLLEEGAS